MFLFRSSFAQSGGQVSFINHYKRRRLWSRTSKNRIHRPETDFKNMPIWKYSAVYIYEDLAFISNRLLFNMKKTWKWYSIIHHKTPQFLLAASAHAREPPIICSKCQNCVLLWASLVQIQDIRKEFWLQSRDHNIAGCTTAVDQGLISFNRNTWYILKQSYYLPFSVWLFNRGIKLINVILFIFPSKFLHPIKLIPMRCESQGFELEQSVSYLCSISVNGFKQAGRPRTGCILSGGQ